LHGYWFGVIIDVTTGENEMEITKALEVIANVQDNLGLGLLETLMEMGSDLDNFTDTEVRAYRRAMADFQKMFAPA
jgi:hypothetical protein